MHATVTLLGSFQVAVGGAVLPATGWNRRHAASLVKLLSLQPSRRMHREQVIDALWPDLSVDEAAPRLHKAAHYARRALRAPGSLVLADETVALWPGGQVDVDALEFEDLARKALAVRDPAVADRALARYVGDLLPHDVYEPWLEVPRERLRLLHLDLLRLASRWEELAAADPADEEAAVELMRSLVAAGARRSALRQFERLERALGRELGVGPGPAALALHAQLLAAEEPPEDVESVDLHAPLGRHHELAVLEAMLDTVSSGRGRALFVSGRPGSGKTTLLHWLQDRASDRRMRVGYGAGGAVEAAWPYAPVLEALSDLCRRHPTLLDGLDDAFRDEIERALSGRRLRWTGESSHQRLFVAAAELLRLAAAGGGAVVVLDDAHDTDDATVRLVHYLVRATATDRVLIAVAHLDAPTSDELVRVRTSLLAREVASALTLAPLGRDDTEALLRRRVPDADESLVERVWQASAGVPFVVSELGRATSAGETMPVDRLLLHGVPQDVVAALRAVAVLGATFGTDELVAVTGWAEEDAYAVLDVALATRMIERAGPGYRFRHAMLRDALLDGLPHHRVQELHRKAADALVRLAGSPARVGHHLVEAGRLSRAVPFLLQAAETEAALGAYRDALARLDLIRDRVEGSDRSRLLALRADLLTACGDAAAVAAYREALASSDDPRLHRRLRPRLARVATFVGDLETAQAALEGLELDGSASDTGLLLARGNLALFQGDLDAADEAAAEARRRVALAGGDDWQLYDLIALQGLVEHNRGRWFERLRHELRQGSERPDLASSIFDSHLCVAEYLLYGPTPYDEVLELADTLRRTAQRAGVLRAVAFATALRGEAALLKGDLELAAAELSDAADLHHDLGSTAGEAHSLQRLAEVHLAYGDRRTAGQLLLRALPLARWSTISLHLLQRVYGTMIQSAPDPQAARAVVDRAEATLGTNDQCPFCSIMLAVPAARACADVGDVEDARRHLEAAERSVVLWEGTSWQAAILEVRAHLARASGDAARANQLLDEAAALFELSGQPLDAGRCRV
ncbi:MAG TPA: BREX system ATP-binding domain-containing protein [Actinomycetes bacterium]